MRLMTLKETYEAISAQLNLLDFEVLWPGFKRYPFALYQGKKAIIHGEEVSKPDVFMANTAVYFEDEWWSIWQLQETDDLEVLTAKIVHEMVHAFQQEQQDPRFVNEMEALLTHEFDASYWTLKKQELSLLDRVYKRFTTNAWEDFLAFRNARLHQHPDLVDYECGVEQIEGLAQFIELKTLKRLDEAKAQKMLEGCLQRINHPSRLFERRTMAYDVGCVLFELIEQHQITVALNDHEPLMVTLIKYLKPSHINESVDPDVSQAWKAQIMQHQTLINESLKQTPIFEGDVPLLGVNVYDAKRLDNYLITTYFVYLGPKENPQLFEGNYIVELHPTHHVKALYPWKGHHG